MRIIAGTHRGRRVEAPPGCGTRPMLDRVREAIFSTLAPWMNEAFVLDLFAGSGSLSFEALSRGAALARLVERSPAAAVTAGRNAEELGLSGRVQLACGDALDPELWGAALPPQAVVDLEPSDEEDPVNRATQVLPPDHRWDVCLCDPPYPLLRDAATRERTLQAVRRLVHEHLAGDGVLVLHAPDRELEAAELGAPELSVARRTYGSNAIWYVQTSEETP